MIMKRGIPAFVLLISLWSTAGYGEGMDIPELGVHIAEVASGSQTPEVAQRVDGYVATLHIGTAVLVIARVDEPVPSGSDIRDAAFRTAQRAEFYEQPDRTDREQATVISGHDAWTILSARRAGGWARTVHYSCVTYTVVDQHVYRMAVFATGGEEKPLDYEAAVHTMSELRFVPVNQSSESNSRGATGLLKMPKPKPRKAVALVYPRLAMRRREQGVVDVEFSIDGRGHAQDLQETNDSASSMLREAARAALKSVDFQVKPSWEANGYQRVRLTAEFQFWLGTDISHCPAVLPARASGAIVFSICASLTPL
jgi:TonB family protein